MARGTEELAGTTVVDVEEKGGAEARAKVGQGGAKGARRVMRCGDWIRLGDAAADVVEEVDHSTTSRRRGAGA